MPSASREEGTHGEPTNAPDLTTAHAFNDRGENQAGSGGKKGGEGDNEEEIKEKDHEEEEETDDEDEEVEPPFPASKCNRLLFKG
jgi:hypothetical protein